VQGLAAVLAAELVGVGDGVGELAALGVFVAVAE
jgi:hypothetical protein